MAAMGAALLMVFALVSVGVTFHEHVTDVQDANHTDCAACHFRHLSVVETDGTPVPSELDLVAHTVASAHPDGALGNVLDTRPTRGPPA